MSVFALSVSDLDFSKTAVYLIQVTVVVAIGLTVARRFVWNAAIRYRILMLTWFAVMVLPIVSMICQASGVTTRLYGSFPELQAFAHSLFEPQQPGRVEQIRSCLVSADEAPSVGWTLPRPHEWFVVLSMIWLGGMAVQLTRLVSALCDVSRLLSRAAEASPGSRLASMGATVAHDFALSSVPPIRISAALATPAVCGLLKPSVVFPAQLARQMNDEQLGHVMTHEIAHVVRRDHLAVLAQQLLAAVFWFHPMVKVLNRRLSQAREEVCDNHVLGRASRVDYGYTLLGIAESVEGSLPLRLSVGFLADSWSLETRISQMLDSKRTTTTTVRGRAALPTCLASVTVTAVLALANPVPVVDDDLLEPGHLPVVGLGFDSDASREAHETFVPRSTRSSAYIALADRLAQLEALQREQTPEERAQLRMLERRAYEGELRREQLAHEARLKKNRTAPESALASAPLVPSE